MASKPLPSSPPGSSQAMIDAMQRLVAGQASPEDLAGLQIALAEGRITVTTGDVQGFPQIDSRGAYGFLYQPSGSVQQNFIEVSGAAQFQALLDLLQRYTPPPPPEAGSLPDPGPLPPGARLPFHRNAVFTGREADLKALARCLLHGGQSTVGVTHSAAATGAGGLGKTQLAVEFCYRYGRFFHGVHWLQANLDLLAEIAACGEAMGLTPWPETLPEQVQATLRAWGRGGTRLVVLDNVEDPIILEEWLPRLNHARVLITSRQRDWPADLGLGLLPLDSLPRPESLALLRRLAPRLEKIPDTELDELAGRLGDLPLALDLAGRYLNDRQGLSLAGFLKELEQAGGALQHSALKDWTEHNPTRHDTNLAASFTLSWNRLEERAQRLLCAAGYCAANTPIPWEVFYRLGGTEEGQTQAAVDKALGALEDGGLVSLAEAGPLLHPLLAEFARLQDGAAEESALPGLAEALGELSYEANESGLPERFKPLRAHLEAAAGWAERDSLEQAGTLWNNLGWHLQDVAEYAGARLAYERALRIDEAAFGPDHPKVATDVNNLGGVLQSLGDLAGARLAFERALRIDEAAFGPDHPKVAIRVNNLGGVLKDLGDLAGARLAFERALRIDEAAFGPDHPEVATDVNNLGTVLKDLGDLAGAQAAYERALAILEKNLPLDHPHLRIVRGNLEQVVLEMKD